MSCLGAQLFFQRIPRGHAFHTSATIGSKCAKRRCKLTLAARGPTVVKVRFTIIPRMAEWLRVLRSISNDSSWIMIHQSLQMGSCIRIGRARIGKKTWDAKKHLHYLVPCDNCPTMTWSFQRDLSKESPVVTSYRRPNEIAFEALMNRMSWTFCSNFQDVYEIWWGLHGISWELSYNCRKHSYKNHYFLWFSILSFVEPFSPFNLQHLLSGRIGIHFDGPRILSPIAIGQDLWSDRKEMEHTMNTQIKI